MRTTRLASRIPDTLDALARIAEAAVSAIAKIERDGCLTLIDREYAPLYLAVQALADVRKSSESETVTDLPAHEVWDTDGLGDCVQ